MMFALEILLLLLTAGSLVFYLACAFFTQRFFEDSKRSKLICPLTSPPAVSLLIPVRGVDAALGKTGRLFVRRTTPTMKCCLGSWSRLIRLSQF